MILFSNILDYISEEQTIMNRGIGYTPELISLRLMSNLTQFHARLPEIKASTELFR